MKFVDIDIWQLKEKNEKKKIVFFGGGAALKNFIQFYSRLGCEYNINYVVDNDWKKDGTEKVIDDLTLKITSFSKFLSYPKNNFIFVITVTDFFSIVEQLNTYKQFDDIEYCISTFVISMTKENKEKERYYPDNLRIYKEEKIPPIIHYCWFGGEEIPEKNKHWMSSWREKCPKFEILEWNETNYDIKKNKFMYEAYKAKKWGFVSDFARLDIIYNHGGIYLDNDIEIIRDLEDLLYQDAFAGVDNSWHISLGLGFGAKKHHSLIKELLMLYENLDFDEQNMIPAPAMMNTFFEKYGYQANGEFQTIGNMTIYPEKILSGKNNLTGLIMPTDRTFSIHHYDGSWCKKEALDRKEKIHQFYQNTLQI